MPEINNLVLMFLRINLFKKQKNIQVETGNSFNFLLDYS